MGNLALHIDGLGKQYRIGKREAAIAPSERC